MDLFASDAAPDLETELRLAFTDWVAHRATSRSSARSARPMRAESIEVYEDMWQVFVAWSVARGEDLATLSKASLLAFLDSLGGAREPSPRYARRMLGLVDRVARHRAEHHGLVPSPAIAQVGALPRYRFADALSEEPLPDFLASNQARALIDFLTRPITARELGPDQDPDAASTWQELRNRTAVALQLGAGLTPGEARAMTLGGVLIEGGPRAGEPWALEVAGNGNYPARQTPLAPWAGALLRSWLQVRAEQGIPGDVLFPAVRRGRAWSKPGAFTAYKAVLTAAGIDPVGGSFKLRHTFALRQLTRHDEETVIAWLGIQDPEIMARYRRVLFQPVDVV